MACSCNQPQRTDRFVAERQQHLNPPCIHTDTAVSNNKSLLHSTTLITQHRIHMWNQSLTVFHECRNRRGFQELSTSYSALSSNYNLTSNFVNGHMSHDDHTKVTIYKTYCGQPWLINANPRQWLTSRSKMSEVRSRQ